MDKQIVFFLGVLVGIVFTTIAYTVIAFLWAKLLSLAEKDELQDQPINHFGGHNYWI